MNRIIRRRIRLGRGKSIGSAQRPKRRQHQDHTKQSDNATLQRTQRINQMKTLNLALNRHLQQYRCGKTQRQTNHSIAHRQRPKLNARIRRLPAFTRARQLRLIFGIIALLL